MLTLHIRHADDRGTTVLARQFDKCGGLIGRGAQCALVLPDPEKHISRVQAEVRYENGDYWLLSQSEVNSVAINGAVLPVGQPRALRSGDEIAIAHYLLMTEIASQIEQPGKVYRSWEQPLSQPGLNASELAEVAEQSANAHKLDFEPPPKTRATVMLDDLNRQALAAALRSPTRDSASPGSDTSAALLEAFLRGAGLTELPSLPGAKSARSLDPATMQRIGELLKLMSQFTVDLLAARAHSKQQIQAELTVIEPRQNNPLKFATDSTSALAQLLAIRPARGFVDGPAAVRDAYADLSAHQAGLEAGMKSAIQGVIARFAPTELEHRLRQRSMLASMLPINRKAKLWELFNELFSELANEAEVDFQALLSREFVLAYEEQIARLAQKE